MKQCSKCKEWKDESEFCKRTASKDGLCPVCRECVKKYKVEHYLRNKESIREKHKHYRKCNLDAIREQQRKYYRENCKERRESERERGKKYHEENREAINERARNYYHENIEAEREQHRKRYRENCEEKREVWRERDRKYRDKNREAVNERCRKYQKNNKSKMNAKNAKRRARKLKLTPQNANMKEIQFLYDVCSETNEILNGTFFSIDHIQPLCKGGLHHEENLQIIETELNLKKSGRWPLSENDQVKYKGVLACQI